MIVSIIACSEIAPNDSISNLLHAVMNFCQLYRRNCVLFCIILEPKKPEMPTGPLCSLCEIVVEQLDKLIATNKSEVSVMSSFVFHEASWPECIIQQTVCWHAFLLFCFSARTLGISIWVKFCVCTWLHSHHTGSHIPSLGDGVGWKRL